MRVRDCTISPVEAWTPLPNMKEEKVSNKSRNRHHLQEELQPPNNSFFPRGMIPEFQMYPKKNLH